MNLKTSFNNRFLGILSLSLITTLLLYSCGAGINIQIQNVKGPFIFVEDKHLVITTSFNDLKLKKDLYYDIPQFQNSGIDLIKNGAQGTSISFRISIEEILGENSDYLKIMNLPSDRQIPNVVGGGLPGTSFSIENFEQITIYSSPEYFGIFIPYDGIDLIGLTTFRYYLKGEAIGYISLLGKEDETETSGMLLLLEINQSIRDELNTLR